MLLTLDTNCLCDLDEDRPAAASVRELGRRARAGEIGLAIAVSSASERQIDRTFLTSFDLFRSRLAALGMDQLELLPTIARADVAFWDLSVWGGPEAESREEEIYSVMFPTSPFRWPKYAAARGVEPNNLASVAYGRWKNQLLDAQAFWAHEHAGRDIFVTSDRRFKVLEGMPERPGKIRTPDEALLAIL